MAAKAAPAVPSKRPQAAKPEAAANGAAATLLTAEPVDKQTRVVGGRAVPLLDPQWVTEMRCIAFEPPPPPLSSQAVEDAWQERCQFIADDLQELLGMPHWRFWCQLLHDRSIVSEALDSYLRLAPRWFDEVDWARFSEPVRDSVGRMHRLVFLVCLRLSTHRETPDHYLSETAFAEAHTRIALFTPPRLLDLCALYWPSNRQLVARMVQNLLRRLPNLRPELLSALTNLGTKVLLDATGGSISSSFDEAEPAAKPPLPVDQLADRLLFARDAVETLAALDACCRAQQGAEVRPTAGVIESALPRLYEALVPQARIAFASHAGTDSQPAVRRAAYRLHRLCLTLYFQLWAECPLSEKDRAHRLLLGLSQLMHSCLRFLAALEAEHELSEELERLQAVDLELTDYIVKAIVAAVAEFGEHHPAGAAAAAAAGINSDGDEDDEVIDGGFNRGGIVNSAFAADEGDAEGRAAAVPAPSSVELESMVSHVQDIFPSIGAGFVKECLRHYAYDTERLINALLEDSLPASLNRLDRGLLTAPSEAVAASGVRRNSATDEFDFKQPERLDRDALRGRLHRGKRDRDAALPLEQRSEDEAKLRAWLTDWEQRLRDNEEAEEQAELRERTEAAEAAAAAAAAYEDEYDDTYEGAAIAADGASSSSSSEDDEGEVQQQQQQQQQQHQQQYDVRGSGRRGRGQSHQVVHNRAVKERDKSYRANHNRRHLSDRKRAGGMF